MQLHEVTCIKQEYNMRDMTTFRAAFRTVWTLRPKNGCA